MLSQANAFFYHKVNKYTLSIPQRIALGYPPFNQTSGRNSVLQNGDVRICSRCGRAYTVDAQGFATPDDTCRYHPQHQRLVFGQKTFTCCGGRMDADGCLSYHTHVSNRPYMINLDDYQATSTPISKTDPRSTKVYAVDCEMCYTTHGLELCRVGVVDEGLEVVFEAVVVPAHPVIDYNTQFTGITKETIDSFGISVGEVRARLLGIWNAATILAGHGLDGDLHALKVIHEKVVDTIAMFPHCLGLPFRRSLRDLAKEFLGKEIQNSAVGHNSVEDAGACMELVHYKV